MPTNECANATLNLCAYPDRCIDTEANFTCSCPSGFSTSDNGMTCFDIDECTAGTHQCHPMAACNNTFGSYECFCNAQGYTGDGFLCSDLDECASNLTNVCDVNANCENSPGGYSCACKFGFDGDGNATSTGCTPWSPPPGLETREQSASESFQMNQGQPLPTCRQSFASSLAASSRASPDTP